MKKMLLTCIGICLLIVAWVVFQLITPPTGATFPVVIQYKNGEPLSQFVGTLQGKHIITYPKLFKFALVLVGVDTTLQPNIYTFTEPQNILKLTQQLAHDSRRATGVKVVIPEGTTNKEIIEILEKAFPELARTFTGLKKDEGYFFPDTYFFSINSTAADVEQNLRSTFSRKTKDLLEGKSDKEVHDILTMASILEKEGRGFEERKMIAGILYKRIQIGMPLQVDATFLYTLSKGSKDLTVDDLQTDSPYNTYTRKGLPIGPINNPGLETITAALNPTASPYLYYLHDGMGIIHYAKTFEEHKRNKQKYLR